MLAGDFSLDCSVDSDDLVIMAAAWLSAEGSARWEPACDMASPKDKFINQRDFAAFAEHWLEETP